MCVQRWGLVLLATSVLWGCGDQNDESGSSAAGSSGAGSASTPAGSGGTSANDGGKDVGGRAGMGSMAGASSAGAGGSTTATGGMGAGGRDGGAAGTGTSCQAPLLTGDHAQVEAQEHVETYAVQGTTAAELRSSIDANSGREFAGLTTWQVRWRFQDCASATPSVLLDISYSMPSWDAPSSADPALSASFRKYLDALYCHEYGHGKLALECAKSLYETLAKLPGAAECDALKATATTQAQALLEDCSKRQDAYDTETMHGATMGAVFPPP